MNQVLGPRALITWSVGTTFIFISFLFGKINENMAYADVFMPVLLVALIFIVRSDVDQFIVSLTGLIILYGLISSVSHLYLNGLEIFFSFVIVSRSVAFLIVLLFFSSAAKRFGLKYLAVFLSVALIAMENTISQYVSGVRSYYGYARVGANTAPANTGFLLGILTIGLFVLSLMQFKTKRRITGMMFGLLSVCSLAFTFSSGSKSSILGALIASVVLVLYIAGGHQLKRRFVFVASGLVSALILLVSWSLVSKQGLIFSSLERFQRLDISAVDRFGKWVYFFSSGAKELSSPLLFVFAGMGPGAIANFQYQQGTSFFNFDSILGRMLWEWGPIGVLLWLSLFYFVLVSTYRRWQPAGIGIGSLYVFAFAYGFGVEFLWIAPSGYIFAALVGMMHGSSYPTVDRFGANR